MNIFKNIFKHLYTKYKTKPFRFIFDTATIIMAIIFIIKINWLEDLIDNYFWQFGLVYIILGQISMVLDDKIRK